MSKKHQHDEYCEHPPSSPPPETNAHPVPIDSTWLTAILITFTILLVWHRRKK